MLKSYLNNRLKIYSFIWPRIPENLCVLDLHQSYGVLTWKRFAHYQHFSWWRHQMETFSALLALCAGNSPVTGECPSQRPQTRRFDVLFDLRLNRRLSIQSRRWWFGTLSRPRWRHSNVEGYPPVTGSSPDKISAELWLLLFILGLNKLLHKRLSCCWFF